MWKFQICYFYSQKRSKKLYSLVVLWINDLTRDVNCMKKSFFLSLSTTWRPNWQLWRPLTCCAWLSSNWRSCRQQPWRPRHFDVLVDNRDALFYRRDVLVDNLTSLSTSQQLIISSSSFLPSVEDHKIRNQKWWKLIIEILNELINFIYSYYYDYHFVIISFIDLYYFIDPI